ncbi:MAG: aminotransferase class I/II-fold pyridoxal phosphate-dependent enzyme [Bacteroidetes bacterium]|nr:aminotransferase class I/II-fold pyridoxal phosphate-dependent enzyme [Bacteroidota bacterium]
MSKRIYLSPPHMCGEEQKYIERAFKSNWIAPVGPAITEFENKLAQYNAIDHCVAVSSGTAAIHLALITLGVGKGDEVICSSFTFSGSCNPIMYQSATPVFIDSEPESWNMDPTLLEQAIQDRIRLGKKPKAIIVVHLFGMPANMDKIMPIAKQHEIPVIEDAAEALGSIYNGRKAGTIGDIGIFSFNGNKIITTSGGGAMVSFCKEWIDRARFLSSQSRTPAPYYLHEEVGYNYQLSNICASIGLGQMHVLEERIKTRRANFCTYKNKLGEEQFSFQLEAENSVSNRWLTTVLIKSNFEHKVGEVLTQLETKNIEGRRLWKPMHVQPIFKNAPAYVNGVSESLFLKGLCLPSGSNLTEEEIGFIVDNIRSKM